VKAARRYARVCSPCERELLKGILPLTDFTHVADDIAGGEAYWNMTRCGRPFRESFAACVVMRGSAAPLIEPDVGTDVGSPFEFDACDSYLASNSNQDIIGGCDVEAGHVGLLELRKPFQL